MEGILFVISPVWWNTAINGLSLIIALLGGIFIGLSIAQKQSIKIVKNEVIIPSKNIQLIPISDPQYAEKTLGKIREYLTHRYYPMHSWAHIPTDIRSYTTDSELITIIEKLEKMEFSGRIPEQKIIEKIQQDLIRKLQS